MGRDDGDCAGCYHVAAIPRCKVDGCGLGRRGSQHQSGQSKHELHETHGILFLPPDTTSDEPYHSATPSSPPCISGMRAKCIDHAAFDFSKEIPGVKPV